MSNGGEVTVKKNASFGSGIVSSGAGRLTMNKGIMEVGGDLILGRNKSAIIPASVGKIKLTDSTLKVDNFIFIDNSSNLAVSGATSTVAVGKDVVMESNAATNVPMLTVTDGASLAADDIIMRAFADTTVGKDATLSAKTLNIGGTKAEPLKGTLTIEDGGTVNANVDEGPGATVIGTSGIKKIKNFKNSGGKLDVQPGPIDIGGSYSQASSAALEIELDGLNSFGLVDAGRTGAFSAGTSLEFDFAGFWPTVGESFTFFDALGGVNVAPSNDNCANGEFDCSFLGVPPTLDFEVVSAADTLSLVVTGGTAVPEPRVAELFLLGFAALAGRRLLARWSVRSGLL